MKKFFVLLFLIIILFPSCSTTEETVQDETPVGIVEPEVADAAGFEEVVVPDVEPEIPEPVYEPVLEEPSPAAQEPEVAVVEETPLSARDLVEQISETILQPEVAKEMPEVFPEAEPALPEQPEMDGSGDSSEAPAVPAVAESVPVSDEQPVPVAMGVTDVLEEDLDFNYMMVIAVVISIVLLFTIASIIRNRFFQPLAKSISAVLALLFASIPLLVGVIITGWNTIYLLFLLLLSCYFVFRSKSGNMNYR